MNIGIAIVTLRKKQNISQEQLAYASEISRHYMYKLENNLANPTIHTLQKISNVLNIKVSKIITEAEKY